MPCKANESRRHKIPKARYHVENWSAYDAALRRRGYLTIWVTNEAMIATAKEGWGLTRVLHYQIGPALVEGHLRIVLGDYEKPPLPIHILYLEGRLAPAKVRAFIDLAVARLRENRLLNQSFWSEVIAREIKGLESVWCFNKQQTDGVIGVTPRRWLLQTR